MDICERLDASLDGLLETFGRVGLRQMHSRLNSRQHVLGSVLGLARENSDLRLVPLLLVMSRAIFDAPTILPPTPLIGETVTEISILLPCLRMRTVSKCSTRSRMS